MSGKRGKNDAADAAAICEAVTRPNMRFVPVKEEHQQIIPHPAARGGGIRREERTALYNRLRGPTAEFRHRSPAESELPAPRDRRPPRRPARLRQPVRSATCSRTPTGSDVPVEAYDRLIAQAAREDAQQTPHATARHRPDHRQRTSGQPWRRNEFNNGRQVAAWIGLVPGQYSSGGKARLGRITKTGDRYLRSLLVMAPGDPQRAGRETGSLQSLGKESCRTTRLLEAVVAIAAKNAARLGGTPGTATIFDWPARWPERLQKASIGKGNGKGMKAAAGARESPVHCTR